MLFERYQDNPILTAADMPACAVAALNPGAATDGDQVVLLVRAEYATGYSDILVARSDNGVDGWQVNSEPLLAHGLEDMRYEKWGCEDARVVWLEEDQTYYITYTAVSPAGTAVGLARTDDFQSAYRVGLIFSPNNKDTALFPEKIDGKYYAVHRPDAGDGIENIWIASSEDCKYWGQPHCVLEENCGPAWDGMAVGAGPPPIRTEYGWLLIYHGVKEYGNRPVYRAGAALLDLNSPHKVVARTPECILQPDYPYEFSGIMPNVVFPSGLLLRGDELWMYYGAADTSSCLAVGKLQDVLDRCEPADR
ncbi:MAG: glycosidase [Phycisphaerae bacterium]